MIHHLQQQIEQVRVRLFDLVEQDDGMWRLGHSVSEQATLIKADIARRSTDQARHGVALHVFRHVKANKLKAELLGQLPADFRFADTGGPRQQKRANRLLRFLQTGAGQLDGRRQRRDRLILTEHHHFQVVFQLGQRLLVVFGHRFRGNPGNLGDNGFNIFDIQYRFAIITLLQPLVSPGLIDHVDGFVRQETVVDIARRQFGSGFQGGIRILQLVKSFKARLEPLQYAVGLVD